MFKNCNQGKEQKKSIQVVVVEEQRFVIIDFGEHFSCEYGIQ